MGSPPYHAQHITISLADHVTQTMVDELYRYLNQVCIFYAIKVENGQSGKAHIHAAAIFEITYHNGSTLGARTCDSLERSIKEANHCPTIKSYCKENPSIYDVKTYRMESDEFIAGYMQKEEILKKHKLPDDLGILAPYFPDLQKAKPKNTEYEGWKVLYEEDGRPVPASLEDVWQFFGEHMYQDMTSDKAIKIVSDKRKLLERCEAFKCYLNKEVPPLPTLKRKAEEEGVRFCPRCIEQDRDAPNILRPREQFCPGCKKY